MTVAQCVRERDGKVLDFLKEAAEAPLREIASSTDLSKDAVRRAKQAQDKRCVYPESSMWESEEARNWLNRLVIATLLEFGMKDGAGAGRMSRFFQRIHIDKEVGVSETALLRLMHRLEERAAEFGRLQESTQAGKVKEISLGGDEPFFSDMMLLVAMELGSGYLFLEEPAPDRSFATWSERLNDRIKPLGCHVRHFVSDRAKALIKLAVDGLGCSAGADLFHAMQDITRWLGAGFWRKSGKAQKAVLQAQNTAQTDGDALILAQTEQKILEEGKDKYTGLLHKISQVLHPFSLTNKRQDAPQIEQDLSAHATALAGVGEEYEIKDNSGKLGKFRRQIKDLVSTVDAWWLWVEVAIETLDVPTEQRDWVTECLLPKVYWEQQVARTDTPAVRDSYKTAAQSADSAWQAHPLTKSLSEQEIKRCRAWAEWMCRQFQRSSSAIEGRNGYLSQIHHNGRGLSVRRLKALGVIHNFDTYRDDETTPAERLFNTKFPDLFEWLLQDSDALPLPRASRKQPGRNPPVLQAVAA